MNVNFSYSNFDVFISLQKIKILVKSLWAVLLLITENGWAELKINYGDKISFSFSQLLGNNWISNDFHIISFESIQKWFQYLNDHRPIVSNPPIQWQSIVFIRSEFRHLQINYLNCKSMITSQIPIGRSTDHSQFNLSQKNRIFDRYFRLEMDKMMHLSNLTKTLSYFKRTHFDKYNT